MDTYDIYELMIIPPNKKAEMIAREIGKPELNQNLVNDLIILGANLDWQSNDGMSALHYCVVSNHQYIARMLLDAGADKTIPNNDGRIPYELMPYDLIGNSELQELLKV